MKKSPQRDANTALWLYSKADPKIIAQPQTPFPGGADYLQTQFSEDRCTQLRIITVTDPSTHTHPQTHTQTQTDRTDYNTLRRSLARSVTIADYFFLDHGM